MRISWKRYVDVRVVHFRAPLSRRHERGQVTDFRGPGGSERFTVTDGFERL